MFLSFFGDYEAGLSNVCSISFFPPFHPWPGHVPSLWVFMALRVPKVNLYLFRYFSVESSLLFDIFFTTVFVSLQTPLHARVTFGDGQYSSVLEVFVLTVAACPTTFCDLMSPSPDGRPSGLPSACLILVELFFKTPFRFFSHSWSPAALDCCCHHSLRTKEFPQKRSLCSPFFPSSTLASHSSWMFLCCSFFPFDSWTFFSETLPLIFFPPFFFFFLA